MHTKSGVRLSTGNRIGMIVIGLVAGILIIIMLALSSGMKKKIASYQESNAKIEQMILEEQGRAEELERLPDYVASDAFVEKMAREKFGLVYSDEIVFRAGGQE